MSKIWKLSSDTETLFLGEPEAFPFVQYGKKDDTFYSILGGMVAIELDQDFLQSQDFYKELWQQPKTEGDDKSKIAAAEKSFHDWHSKLPAINIPSPVLSLTIPHLPTPPAATVPAGGTAPHLPFPAVTGASDTYYRYECFPVSRRVTTGAIASGTFAFPKTEIAHVSSGFGAVARYALPCYLPASYLHSFDPGGGVSVQCGTCLPQFGQSGGGVEVMFPQQIKPTRVHTTTVIPPL